MAIVTNPHTMKVKGNITIKAKIDLVPYTKESYTTPGTYTFTVPEGVTNIRISTAGAGGGGGGAAEYTIAD